MPMRYLPYCKEPRMNWIVLKALIGTAFAGILLAQLACAAPTVNIGVSRNMDAWQRTLEFFKTYLVEQ